MLKQVQHDGIEEASITRRPSMPRTLSSGVTGKRSSPMATVPAGEIR